MEKPTATRSNNLQWSGMCIKTPLDSDVDEKDLEVLIAFNGSNTLGHYVLICKTYTYLYTYFYTYLYTYLYTTVMLCNHTPPYSTFVHTGNQFVGMPGRPGIPVNQLIMHICCNNFKFYIFGTQVQKRSSLSVSKWLNISIMY